MLRASTVEVHKDLFLGLDLLLLYVNDLSQVAYCDLFFYAETHV